MQTYQKQLDESEDSTIQIKMELAPVELGRAFLFNSQEKNPASDVSPAAAGSGQEAWAQQIQHQRSKQDRTNIETGIDCRIQLAATAGANAASRDSISFFSDSWRGSRGRRAGPP